MKKQLVAIIGRPNVGKSTFFNRIVGKRISIVDDTPGVTRDRIYASAEWTGYSFNMVDTGGLDSKSDDVFQKDIAMQAKIAIDLADVIVFMVDGREGLTQNDEEVAVMLRLSKKPIVLAVNKLDNFEVENSYEFYALGLGDPMPISCLQGKGLGDLLDKIVSYFDEKVSAEEESVFKIAVVGRPNVGKSSIINTILGEDRVLVSNVAGTTRDAIDTPFKWNKKDCLIIDTAGMRRQRSYENQSVEGYSVLRTLDAIERADVVLIVMDSSEEISEQDVRIAGFVHEANKPSVIVMNKWDLVEKSSNTINEYKKDLEEKLKFMDYFKTVFVSAKTKQRFGDILTVANEAYENASKRITTGLLNEVLTSAILANEPPYVSGRKVKISYITQVQTNPPTFLLFVNDSKGIHFSYLRYIENYFRKSIDFSGTPIKIILRDKQEENF
ncbi:MAG: ribosome biogenesis GTPase Der [Christensenellales bacterium]|jgi:GTP-binding protein